MQNKAFTLVETLVVITIMSILLIVGLNTFNNYRNYNIASGYLNDIKILLKQTKWQTYTIREKADEYTYGIGVQLKQRPPTARVVKIAATTPRDYEYVAYPSGSIAPSLVVFASEESDVENLELPQNLQFTTTVNNTPRFCVITYVIFEIPTGKPHFYCQSSSTSRLVPYTGVNSFRISFSTLRSKGITINSYSQIYVK